MNFCVDEPAARGEVGVEARLNRDTTYFGISPTRVRFWWWNSLFARVILLRVDSMMCSRVNSARQMSSLLLGFRMDTHRSRPPYASNGAHIGPADQPG